MYVDPECEIGLYSFEIHKYYQKVGIKLHKLTPTIPVEMYGVTRDNDYRIGNTDITKLSEAVVLTPLEHTTYNTHTKV